jgi:4a-hydroxytetrahydrobiopterin dehydratase
MSWIEENGTLVRTLQTPDFLTAFKIVSALVGPAEALNHHPDIAFGWGYVRIAVTTHDAGGITERDHQLTRVIDLSLKPFGV